MRRQTQLMKIVWLCCLASATATATSEQGALAADENAPRMITDALHVHHVIHGLVRAQGNSIDSGPASLAPVCAERSVSKDDDAMTTVVGKPDDAPAWEEAKCGNATGVLEVRFNSRSYALATTAAGERCADQPFGSRDYDCVDYRAGALYLAGQTLSFTVNLSTAGCGCNAAVYLVAMPQNSGNPERKSGCGDYYCDANDVCGERCVEIDLMEANRVAFVSTAHAADDGSGEGYGMAHYATSAAQRLEPSEAHGSDLGHGCAYGPSASCTIDTQKPFSASYDFAPAGVNDGFRVSLTQEGRRAVSGPVAYRSKPQQGGAADAAEANAEVARSLADGMTLVVSYWSGGSEGGMSWLDAPCSAEEMEEWECSDAWSEHPHWEWLCPGDDSHLPPGTIKVRAQCGTHFTLSDIRSHPPPPPAPPAPPPAPPSPPPSSPRPPAAPYLLPSMLGIAKLAAGVLVALGALALGAVLGVAQRGLRPTGPGSDKEAVAPLAGPAAPHTSSAHALTPLQLDKLVGRAGRDGGVHVSEETASIILDRVILAE